MLEAGIEATASAWDRTSSLRLYVCVLLSFNICYEKRRKEKKKMHVSFLLTHGVSLH